jgi:hypothetical protein
LSGNDEKPKIKNTSFAKEDTVIVIATEEEMRRQVELNPWRFGMGRTCPICKRLVTNEVFWNDRHKVCVSCYHGVSPRHEIVTEHPDLWRTIDDDDWNDADYDDEEYDDDE